VTPLGPSQKGFCSGGIGPKEPPVVSIAPCAATRLAPPLCHAEVVLYEPDALCEPSRGWAPPAGSSELRPLARSGPLGQEYVCDLLPLTGEARVRCETEAAPLTCESGYCIPESPPLTGACPADEYGILRLQGSAAPPFGGIELTCDFE
jgi:hypothetical protein